MPNEEEDTVKPDWLLALEGELGDELVSAALFELHKELPHHWAIPLLAGYITGLYRG